MLCSECFVISNWYHSPCLSWDPPKEDDSGRVALLGRGATFWFRSERLSFPPGPPRTSPYLRPSLGASRVEFQPCPTCGHEVESDAADALQCVRKLWFWRGIGITSSFTIAFFVCQVVRCSELAILGLSVVLVRQNYVIFDGDLSETPPLCSGETTCPMGRQ